MSKKSKKKDEMSEEAPIETTTEALADPGASTYEPTEEHYRK